MIKQKVDYSNVKKAVERLLGEKVKIAVNVGRNKFVSFDATVSACYQALFTVAPLIPFTGKTSFSYSEVLCGSVRIKRQ